ncbi:receptor-type tyrosine-protein phosphatase epsilon-like [Watersipora subatra]|uniref:receptor-type tyrosine-protein phosphatase epsilon-like n=1 Tax=Watersipora subatra TaxID=2589382 RepID=UPI00355C0FFD
MDMGSGLAIEWSFFEQKPVVDDTLVTLTLPTPLNLQSPEGYENLLIAVQKKSRVKRELSGSDIEANDNYYITAELPVSSLSNIFTIGDNNTYGSYINRPLQFGSYAFYIGLKPVTEDVADFTTSPYWQIEIMAPPGNPFEKAALIGGTGGGLAFILLIAVILVVLLLRKRSRKGSKKAVGAQHTGLEMSSANAIMRWSRHIEEEAAEPLLHTKEDKNLYANVGLGTPNTPPILVSQLHLVVQRAKEDNPDSPFEDEYSQIGHPNMACNDGKKTENAKKNRFKDIMACDATRVKLTIANDSDTDYINANYIKDAKKRNKFIACQGPIDHTIEDMWRMIHDTNSSTIVMLTNPVEANRAKCSIYYPEGEISCEVFGRFEVRLVEEQRFAEYTIRKLKYTFGERTRAVRLFHFTAWPDHGVPTTAGLLDFRHRVKQEMAINTGPTIVHCSAGVGRTGTFIALDLLIEEAMNQPKKSESKVNVAACVHRMRLQRPKMIQTAEQYAFLYEVLVEALVCGETAVTCAQFDEELIKWRNRNGKEKCTLELMFDRSKITCSPITDNQFSAGKALENRDRNRDQSVLPLESHRILLPETQVNKAGYINAISCNGYHTKSGLIVTQTPLAHTEHDFWNMLLMRESAVIVHLNNNEDEQAYWPYEPGTQTAIRDITVQCVHCILGSDGCSETELCVVHQGKRLDVLLIELQLPNGELPNTIQLLTLCRKIERYASSSRDTITIQCSNGNTLSGLFVVAMNLFLRARIEQEVDIVLEVKLARRSRPEFIDDFASFNLLHEFVTTYLSEFSEYSNFK